MFTTKYLAKCEKCGIEITVNSTFSYYPPEPFWICPRCRGDYPISIIIEEDEPINSRFEILDL